MNRPALIVCEPTSHWATALRRASADAPLRMVETRLPGELWRQLADRPGSVVALAWTDMSDKDASDALDTLARRYPRSCLVVLLERDNEQLHALARELGAVHVCRSVREVSAVVRLARRHLGSDATPRHWPAIEERLDEIWQTLPWNPA
jgi:hypothetical protein